MRRRWCWNQMPSCHGEALHPLSLTVVLLLLMTFVLCALAESEDAELNAKEDKQIRILQLDTSRVFPQIMSTILFPGFQQQVPEPASYVYYLISWKVPAHVTVRFTDFFLLKRDGNFSECGENGTHFKIVDNYKSSYHCGVQRPQPILSTTQCLKLELRILDLSCTALIRAEYKVLSSKEFQKRQLDMQEENFVQSTTLLTSDLGSLRTTIIGNPCCKSVDYLWYVCLRKHQEVLFTLEDVDINPLSTLEIRDGPTSTSPLIFSTASNVSVPQFVMSEEEFVQVRWFGPTGNFSFLDIIYTSITPLGHFDDSECQCMNGGICQPQILKCTCPKGYIGKRCQLAVDGKSQHFAAIKSRCNCRNGGTCTPTSSGYAFVCNCPPGYMGIECALNNTMVTEYGIAMGAAVVAVLLVMFGIALCMCVILQYIRQQREGPEGNYRPALSRDVYSVEGVNISGITRVDSMEANDYIPPSYSQCIHSTPNSPMESEVFLSPAHSNQSVRAGWPSLQHTPDSPPPTYNTVLGFAICKQCSLMRKGSEKVQSLTSLGSEPSSHGRRFQWTEYRPYSHPSTPQDITELREVR